MVWGFGGIWSMRNHCPYLDHRSDLITVRWAAVQEESFALLFHGGWWLYGSRRRWMLMGYVVAKLQGLLKWRWGLLGRQKAFSHFMNIRTALHAAPNSSTKSSSCDMAFLQQEMGLFSDLWSRTEMQFMLQTHRDMNLIGFKSCSVSSKLT